eukprot:Gb_26209 [translate_table: standard]
MWNNATMVGAVGVWHPSEMEEQPQCPSLFYLGPSTDLLTSCMNAEALLGLSCTILVSAAVTLSPSDLPWGTLTIVDTSFAMSRVVLVYAEQMFHSSFHPYMGKFCIFLAVDGKPSTLKVTAGQNIDTKKGVMSSWDLVFILLQLLKQAH